MLQLYEEAPRTIFPPAAGIIRQRLDMQRKTTWTLRPDELRRMAATTADAEKERKMLALADALEEVEREMTRDAKDRGEASAR
jgi:hypothetical protein